MNARGWLKTITNLQHNTFSNSVYLNHIEFL